MDIGSQIIVVKMPQLKYSVVILDNKINLGEIGRLSSKKLSFALYNIDELMKIFTTDETRIAIPLNTTKKNQQFGVLNN